MKIFHKEDGHYQILMEERVAGTFSVKVKYEGIEVTSMKVDYYERTIISPV